MRKVVNQNMLFCADHCKMFDQILEEDLTKKQVREQEVCFDNCLGKHSDSLEHGIEYFSEQIQKHQKIKQMDFSHDTEVDSKPGQPVYDAKLRGEQYLMRQAIGGIGKEVVQDPVYDVPKARQPN